MDTRLLRWALPAAVVVLARCAGGLEPAPDLSLLRPGLSYPTVAALLGGQCEHMHDRGVRLLEWRYEDGSSVWATIHNGELSGLELDDGDAPRGRSTASVRVKVGVQSDMPEPMLRKHLGDHAVTTEDTSDRECRWAYSDGTLTAIFMRGRLQQASWQAAGDEETVVLVYVTG